LTQLEITVVEPPKDQAWAKYLDFERLPRTLRVFSLLPLEYHGGLKNDAANSDFTDDSFVGAPPSLAVIRLPRSPLLTKAFLRHFPRHPNFVEDRHKTPHWSLKSPNLMGTSAASLFFFSIERNMNDSK
jgi:hypothetical protein